MKNWLKIFKNETDSTSAEIMTEIKNLRSEKADVQAVLTELQAELEDKRLEYLGGKGSTGDLKKLKNQVSDARDNIKAFDLAIQKLEALHVKALEQEKDSAISGINKALMDLETDRQELTKKLIKVSGEAAALSYLLRGGEVFSLGPKHTPLALTNVEKQPFYDMFDEVVNGQIPLTAKRMDLIIQRTELLNH